MSEIKTILVPFTCRDEEANALELGLNLAEIFSAHLSCLHISPDPKSFMVPAYVGLGVPVASFDNIIDDVIKRTEADQKAARKKYEEIIGKHRIDHDDKVISPDHASAFFEAIIGDVDDIISTKAKLSDLIIMNRTFKELGGAYKHATISALFDSGRPVLLTPQNEIKKDIALSIMIAWDGSAQAIRAVLAAMPLLRRAAYASKVWVVTIDTEPNKVFSIPPQELCIYLEQHGIEAEAIFADDKGLSVPVSILKEAENLKAEMIIMGAYSHNRIRESILGGVTDFMLDNANIPILMSH